MGSSYTLTQQTQQWIDITKLEIVTLDAQLVETATELVFARVSRVYATTNWLSGTPLVPDQTNCPALVQKAISLLIAAWIYARAYSEVTAETENKYALRLEEMAEALTAGIEAGILYLTDAAVNTFTPADQPAYEPSSATNVAPTYNAMGHIIGRIGSDDVKFRMSARY